MAKFSNPLGDNYNKLIGLEDNKYFIEFDSTSALPVLSPYNGKVIYTREENNGYVVKLEHNVDNERIETRFENLSTIYVSTGQNVNKGERIGMTGRKRMKLFIKNLSTNQSEKPKQWVGGIYVNSFDKSTEKELPKQKTKEKETKISTNSYKDSSSKELPPNLASLLAFPITALGGGFKGILQDLKQEKIDREERKKTKEEEKKQKQLDKEKKKEEEEKNLSPDIQLEQTNKKIVSEEILRIKQLMK